MDIGNYSPQMFRAIMEEEAIFALTQKPVITYSAERVRLWSQITREVEAVKAQPIRYGEAMQLFAERVSIPVKDTDLLIGRMTEESFTPEEEELFRKEYIHNLMRMEGIPTFITDPGHQSFRWKDLIQMGLPAMKAYALTWQEKYATEGDHEKRDFVQGAVMIYDALIRYLERSAEVAESAGLPEAADACRRAAAGAPDSFRSALQLIWTIEFFFCAYISPNPTLTLGRLDLFLIDLYEKDLAGGALSREDAALLIDDFYAKNNLIMGRGEHQMSARDHSPMCTGWHRILCYDAPQYLILSGLDPQSGQTVANDLTALFVERIQPKYKNPVIVFRYSEGFAENYPAIWRSLVSKLRDSASAMIYNDISATAMYISDGESQEDAYALEYFGCNWPTLPGKDRPYHGTFFKNRQVSLLPIVMDAIRQCGEKSDQLHRDDLLQKVYDIVYTKVTSETLPGLPKSNLPNSNLLQFYSCFAYDNIEKGGLFFEHTNLIVPFGGIANLIDVAAAMEYLTTERNYTVPQILEACRADFEGEAVLYALCKNAPKLGDGHPLSSYWAKALPEVIVRAVKDACTDLPPFLKLRFCIENDTWHMDRGGAMDATPDGRKRGSPIAQNSQPAVGSAKNGMTAMLLSLANIPFSNFASGALNVTIQPKNFSGDEGLRNLANILAVYFEKGGLQIQLSAVDRELLLDAQKDPDAHRDLMVRVTGYSAVFVDMCKKAQDDLIKRNTF
ncbi:MAG: hypothetical protein J6R82_00210 [Clostridia bacterium]|nr:hypothetical protein [Clostridia bacterium]